MCRSEFLRDHLDIFDPRQPEFNAHFLDTVMEYQFRLVEVPITFYPRVGVSKRGKHLLNSRAAKVGLRMMLGILRMALAEGSRAYDQS